MNIDDLEHPDDVLDALSAAHEAGHAVVHELVGRPYDFVTLGDEIGPARVEAPAQRNLTDDEIEREVLCALAGGLAEAAIFAGRPREELSGGALADLAHVRALLGSRFRDKKVVGDLLQKAQALVDKNLGKITRVAKELLRRRRLTPAEVRAICGAIAATPLGPAGGAGLGRLAE